MMEKTAENGVKEELKLFVVKGRKVGFKILIHSCFRASTKGECEWGKKTGK